ncbi:MAG: hypothetical protein NTU53_17620 [Planctomycetota bacterium]|nr:hypothetical protein [Planctomycetota bacterium]
MAEKDTISGDAESPSQTANIVPSPVNGQIAPVEHRFQPGNKLSPGRPCVGASIRDWYNIMGSYTPAQVEAVLRDKKASTAKIMAAGRVLDALSRDRNAAGTPIAGAEVDRICDRTAGKPKAFVQLEPTLPQSVEIVFPIVAAKSQDVKI